MILIWVSNIYIFQCLTNFLSKFLIISVLHVYIRTGGCPPELNLLYCNPLAELNQRIFNSSNGSSI